MNAGCDFPVAARLAALVCLLLPAVIAAGCGSDGVSPAVRDLDAEGSRDGVTNSSDSAGERDAAKDEETQDAEIGPVPTAWIDEGKYWLANGEPSLALKAFLEVLKIDPQSQEAIFGAGMSEFVRYSELVAMIFTLPNQYGVYAAGETTARGNGRQGGTGGRGGGDGQEEPGKDERGPESEDDYLAGVLHDLFMKLADGFIQAEFYFSQLEDPAFEFTIEQIPFFVYTRPVLKLRGRFDLADVRFLGAANAAMLWFIQLLAGQDFHTDMLTTVYEGMEIQKEGVDILAVFDLLAKLMAADPRFFTLHEKDGVALFNEGARHLKEAGQLMLEGIDLLYAGEVIDGEDDVTILEESAGGLVLRISNRVDFETQEEEQLTVEFSNELLARARDLAAAMETSGVVVPFSKGPAIQLAVLFGMAARMDLIRFLPFKLPIDVSGFQPGQLAGVLSVLFADSVGFDYGTLLKTPVGLRSFFPLMHKVAQPGGPQDFWMEWECPDETAANGGAPVGGKGFLCSAEATLVDSTHFQSTPYELPPDSHPSPLPYLVWEDPTWGGFLYVDKLFLENKGKLSEFVSPDLAATNLGIHLWLEPLVSLLR